MVAKTIRDVPLIPLEEMWVDGDSIPSPIHLDFRTVLALLADAGFTDVMCDEWLINFNQANRDVVGKLELTAAGALLVTPMQSKAGSKSEAAILGELYIWTLENGGEAHGARLGLRFPNGAVYAPDAAWLSPAQLDAYAPASDTWLLHFCPYFVVEIMSRHDSQAAARRKMADYIAHGAALGWLIDPFRRQVHIYRPGVAPETLENPERVSGAPELPGFGFDVRARIFDVQQTPR